MAQHEPAFEQPSREGLRKLKSTWNSSKTGNPQEVPVNWSDVLMAITNQKKPHTIKFRAFIA